MTPPVRVLLVEASPSIRNLLRRIVAESRRLDLVGETDAPEKISHLICQLCPDVALIDAEGLSETDPESSTFGFVEQVTVPVALLSDPKKPGRFSLAQHRPDDRPAVLLPRPATPDGWQQLREELPELLCGLGFRHENSAMKPRRMPAPTNQEKLDIVGIGASAGGPGAIRELLVALGPALDDLRILVIQHISVEFESSLVKWLGDQVPGSRVAMAANGERLVRGMVRIAPQGKHLRINESDRLKLTLESVSANGRHRPSVDVLFDSLLVRDPARTAAVLLSGMGCDGVQGLLELRRHGVLTLVQDEASSAVFGMPRAALRAGAVDVCLPPREIARVVASRCRHGSS